MSIYTVTLEYRQTYFANIEVSADSAEEACERALALDDSVEWGSTDDGCECGPTYAAEVQTVSAAHHVPHACGAGRLLAEFTDAALGEECQSRGYAMESANAIEARDENMRHIRNALAGILEHCGSCADMRAVRRLASEALAIVEGA